MKYRMHPRQLASDLWWVLAMVLITASTVWVLMPHPLEKVSQMAVKPALFLVDSGARLSDVINRGLNCMQRFLRDESGGCQVVNAPESAL